MKIGIAILCRYSSSRLPGKILREINGRTILGHIKDRLQRGCKGYPIVVTTSDDPSRYRTKEEEAAWELSDPLFRLKKFMEHKGIFRENEEKLREQYKKEVEKQFLDAENVAPYALEDVFNYMYVEMPDDLKKQKEEYQQFLAWKGNRK